MYLSLPPFLCFTVSRPTIFNIAWPFLFETHSFASPNPFQSCLSPHSAYILSSTAATMLFLACQKFHLWTQFYLNLAIAFFLPLATFNWPPFWSPTSLLRHWYYIIRQAFSSLTIVIVSCLLHCLFCNVHPALYYKFCITADLRHPPKMFRLR